MTKNKHTTIRLSGIGRERLERLAPDYDSHTALIEDALGTLESAKLALGRQVWQATSRLVGAIQAGDEAAIGAAQMGLAELLHSLPAATGIMAALRDTLSSKDDIAAA
jgi:hypothetical protein